MKKKKRKLPCELVSSAKALHKKMWLSRLSNEDQKYIHEVVAEVSRRPGTSCTAVAAALKQELEIDCSVGTIRVTLGSMLNEKM